MRLIVGITGATGAPFGVRLLELLQDMADVKTHLVLSRWARSTTELETPYSVREVARLADVSYGTGDQAAPISSGSFRTDGMVVAPCSMKTLAGIRTGYADNLLLRAADVVLKERRKLVLVPRETPLSEIHLDNMLALARMGVVVLPPVPAFYNHPASVADVVDHVTMRVLDQFGLDAATVPRWEGLADARCAREPERWAIVLPRHIGGVESSTEKPQLGLDEIRFSRMLEDFARARDVGRSGRTSLSGNSSIDAVLGNCERDGLVGLSVRFALR